MFLTIEEELLHDRRTTGDLGLINEFTLCNARKNDTDKPGRDGGEGQWRI